MKKLMCMGLALVLLGACLPSVQAGDVAIYTGSTSWIAKADADAQAVICRDKLAAWGVDVTWISDAALGGDLAAWMTARQADGEPDVVILYGAIPPAIYANPNVNVDGSVAEVFIESTDGNTLINHGDWIFYVSGVGNNNGAAGLQNIMDIPTIQQNTGGDNTPVNVTALGKEIASSLGNFWTDRMFTPSQLTGNWVVEAAFATSHDGAYADPAIVRDGNLGRVGVIYQTNNQGYDPKGAVAAEVCSWILGVDRGAATAAGIKALKPVSWANDATQVTVRLLETTGSGVPAAADTTVDLSTDTGTGAFDVAADGAFDGSVTSVVIPAGAAYVDVYYKDSAGGTPTLTAAVTGLASGTQQVSVFDRTFAAAGEVAIYTGKVGWVSKATADAQAQITVDKLAALGVTPTVFSSDTDGPALATWVAGHTNDGQLDVLVLYGVFPDEIYPNNNASPNDSIAEKFIETTDGDAIINHGDAMFYVTSTGTNNGYNGLRNMMDTPSMREDAGGTAAVVTPLGAEIAPSLNNYTSDRPFFVDVLQGNWLVEASIAQNSTGARMDPVIMRDGNLGRIIPALQRSDDALPKGAVSADIITWLFGENPSEAVQFDIVGRPLGGVNQPLKFAAQVQGLTGSPAKVEVDTTVDLSTDSATGAFDTDPNGAFDGSITNLLIPAGSASATFFYKDTTAGTPTITASAAGFASANLPVDVLGRSFAAPGEVAIYSAATWWIDKTIADVQAQLCRDRLIAAGISAAWVNDVAQEADLAAWMQASTNNDKLDVLIIYGRLPDSLYPPANGMPEGSIAELFIESEDGDTIINHGDWMFYKSTNDLLPDGTTSANNGGNGLINMMDLAGLGMGADNTPIYVTAEGATIAPSLRDSLTDRVFFVDQLAGDWYAEAIIAQSADGSRLEPVIVRDGNRGRLAAVLQTNNRTNPKGAVAAEIAAWLLGTQLSPTQIGLAGAGGAEVAIESKPKMLIVSLLDPTGIASPAAADVTVNLATDTATGAFDSAMDGEFDGSVIAVVIPAGEMTATVYYLDKAAGLATLTASDADAGLATGTLAVTVAPYVPILPGEVAIYTGNTSWIAKDQADAQAQICVDALSAAGIPATVYADAASQTALADWMGLATNNGLTDVLVLYGYLPESIYGNQNTQPDGSIAELFVESTDGDMIINHADWMFYVSTVPLGCCNGPAGLENIMDVPGATMAGYDNLQMEVTDLGWAISPSLNDFLTDRPLHLDTLGGEWFVEASLAEYVYGGLADPIIIRDGNRGRIVPALQAADQNDPKGAVAAEIIKWVLDQSTGELGGLAKPMDMNGDGQGDLSDAVALLNHLFLGADGPPCATGNITDEANIALLDANGDETLDLSDAVTWLNFLFLGGRLPEMCIDPSCGECILIPDCPDLCQ